MAGANSGSTFRGTPKTRARMVNLNSGSTRRGVPQAPVKMTSALKALGVKKSKRQKKEGDKDKK